MQDAQGWSVFAEISPSCQLLCPSLIKNERRGKDEMTACDISSHVLQSPIWQQITVDLKLEWKH